MKLIHGLPVEAGSVVHFNGMTNHMHTTAYVPRPDCESHWNFGDIIELPLRANATTFDELLRFARADLGQEAVIELDQEIIRAAATETMFRWWAKWQRQNAEALAELKDKHKVNVLETPADIHKEFLAAWDRLVAKESEKNPLFKKIWESQKAFASVSVPAKRLYYPPYSLAADHYWGKK